jgi:GMP synthase (glutamine-hydrolysing)
MKPFLLMQIRPELDAADNEYDTFLRFTGLKPEQLIRFNLDQHAPTNVNLNDYSGIILGGGPCNSSDPEGDKSPAQRRFEPALYKLVDEIIRQDKPFLGACFGVGVLGTHLGGVVSHKYPEPVGPTTIDLTSAGLNDPLTHGLPASFDAFVGHKEAIETLPPNAATLATSAACPVQMFRVGKNVYATQFHPELDRLITIARSATVTVPEKILQRFVQLYAKILINPQS